MSWGENWPMGLMVASVLLFVGALFAIARFLRNTSERQEGLDWPAPDDLEETRPERRRSTEGFISVGLLAFVVAMTLTHVAFAHRPDRDRQLPPDGVLWTSEALLRDFFPSSERVAYQRMSIPPEERKQLAALTRVERENDTQLLFVARTGARIDGYAFLSEADAGGTPAAFGVQLGADGRVKRVEVMRLLDAEQQEVLDPKFLRQFEGGALRGAPRLHRDIEKPPRCTSACGTAIQTVRRALFLAARLQADDPSPALPVSNERGSD